MIPNRSTICPVASMTENSCADPSIFAAACWGSGCSTTAPYSGSVVGNPPPPRCPSVWTGPNLGFGFSPPSWLSRSMPDWHPSARASPSTLWIAGPTSGGTWCSFLSACGAPYWLVPVDRPTTSSPFLFLTPSAISCNWQSDSYFGSA